MRSNLAFLEIVPSQLNVIRPSCGYGSAMACVLLGVSNLAEEDETCIIDVRFDATSLSLHWASAAPESNYDVVW